MKIVGLTGGIASGKSTVAAMFASRGCPVVDADQLARNVVAVGTNGLSAVVNHFGRDILDEQGELNRERLGAIIFSDDSQRNALNSIVHPLIAQASMEHLAELSAAGHHLAIYEAALIVENDLQSKLQMAALIVVSVSESTQLARLMARTQDNRPTLPLQAARQRISAQLPLADKIAVADYVIDNNGSLSETEDRVQQVWIALTTPTDPPQTKRRLTVK